MCPLTNIPGYKFFGKSIMCPKAIYGLLIKKFNGTVVMYLLNVFVLFKEIDHLG